MTTLNHARAWDTARNHFAVHVRIPRSDCPDTDWATGVMGTEPAKWCLEVFGSPWLTFDVQARKFIVANEEARWEAWDDIEHVYLFHTAEDATLFKLRWG